MRSAIRLHFKPSLRARLSVVLALLGFAGLPCAPRAQTPDAAPQTRAERTHYEETSTYGDVIQFFSELQKRSPLIRIETFGHTTEGRAMPLVILSDPPVSQPRDAAALGKPIVFIMANIHAGEVEGKEAVQALSRRILLGDLRPLLDKLVILIAPDYNADGNERFSLSNRTAQNGPIGGVGIRENAMGLDLNRDYIKMEGPETQALIRLFNQWDPVLTVDLHTTDGSYHGYHLTYSIPLNPTTDANILSYHRDKMMPALTDAMLKNHKYRTYYYGNFNPTYSTSAPGQRGARDERGGQGGRAASGATSRTATRASGQPPASPTPGMRSWYAFSQQPRVGQNYVGMRNRLTILSEAYAYLDFHDRIAVTEAFVEEIFKYAAAHGAEIRALTRRADLDAIARGLTGPPLQVGVEYDYKAMLQPMDILFGEVTKLRNPRTGRDMTAVVPDKVTPEKMIVYNAFQAKRSVPDARVYFFHNEPDLRGVIDTLLAQSIAVETLTTQTLLTAEEFDISAVNKAARPFQGHSEVTLAGEYKKTNLTGAPGDLVVRTAQPLGTLAAYLLEPESEDGFTRWNFLDAYLAPGKVHPVYKLMGDLTAPTRLLETSAPHPSGSGSAHDDPD